MVLGLDKGLDLIRQEPRPAGGTYSLFQLCPSVKQVPFMAPELDKDNKLFRILTLSMCVFVLVVHGWLVGG